MKLDDYKSTMGSVKLDADAKRRILASCKNGTQPSAFTREKRVSPVLRRTLAFVATLATAAAVAVGLFLLMRFIGPETPENPNGDAGSNQEISDELAAVGFRLLSVESTLEGLTARVDSYDAKTKTVGMAWVNNSGKDLGLGRAYSLYKMDGEEWVTTPFEKQVFWEEDFREYPSGTECSNYGVIGSLTRWSDNITAGKYKVEKEFYGDGNKHTVTIIFELTSSTEINGFKLISVDSTLEGLTATVDSYNANTKSIGMTWVNNSGQSLIFGAPYTILKLIDGEWSAWGDKESTFQADARLFPSGDTCSDYGVIGSLTRWSDNITPGRYKVEKVFNGMNADEKYIVTIIFELTSEETEEETANEGISNFRVISTNELVTASFGGYKDEVMTLVWENDYADLYYKGIYYINIMNENGEWVCPADVDFIVQDYPVEKGQSGVKNDIHFSTYFPQGAERGEYKIEITLYSKSGADSVKLEVYFTLEVEGVYDFSCTVDKENLSAALSEYKDSKLTLQWTNYTSNWYIHEKGYDLYSKTSDGKWKNLGHFNNGSFMLNMGPVGYSYFDLSSYFYCGVPSGEYKINFEMNIPGESGRTQNTATVEIIFKVSNPSYKENIIDLSDKTILEIGAKPYSDSLREEAIIKYQNEYKCISEFSSEKVLSVSFEVDFEVKSCAVNFLSNASQNDVQAEMHLYLDTWLNKRFDGNTVTVDTSWWYSDSSLKDSPIWSYFITLTDANGTKYYYYFRINYS